MVNPDAATIARECKALQPTLKEYIQKRDPWDRDVEIQRRALQKQFLLLLLNHPYAKESRDTETHLWMQTSYALITSYKARISNLEQALREAGTQRQQGKQQRHGPVEYRKVIQRFKQFLATDEKFWTQLIVRLHSQFVLNEADSALIALHITVSDEPDPKGGATDDSRRERSGHFQFPIEPTEAQPPATPTQRANRLATLSKALVCLGDLARYREQYSEPGHRKQDESSKRGGRRGGGRQNQASIEVKMKTYDKARACYERARNLVPDEGNASHQLAILSAYQKDTFECIVHYYRAFCVRVSYDPVTVNMGNVLSRFLRSWKGKQSKNTAVDHGGGQSKQRLSSLKENVIALHALWNQKGADALGQFPDLEAHVVSEFQSLVTDRALPADVITKIVLLAQGAHWYHKESTSQSTANTSDATASILDRIAMHMLQLYTSLYEVGIHELKESSNIPEDDLAMRITAVLRRTLPALRIIGKWLRANMAIFQSIGLTIVPPPTLHTFRSALSTFGDLLVFTFPPSRLSKLNRPLEEDLELAGYLPLGGLLMDSATRDPEDTRALEEVHPNEEQLMRIWDVYQDVSRLNDDRRPDVQRHSFRTQHRNRSSAEEETISLDIPDPQRPADEIKPVVSWQISKKVPQDDDARTETTDPVGDAFRQALLASDSDSERDEIVWNPRPSRSPSSTLLPKPGAPQSAVSTHNPATGRVLSSQVQAPIGPNYGAAAQPSSHPATAAVVSPGPPTMQPHTPKTTAQDLLANVLGTGKTPSSRPRYVSQATPIVPSPLNPIAPPPEPTALPQPHLLFGGTSPTAASFGPGQSIWSASADEGSLGVHRRRASHSGFQPPASIPRAAPPFLPPTQSPWSGSPDRSIPAHTQRLHPQPGVNASFSPNNLPQIGGHRRVPSSTLPSSASYPAHPAGYGNLDMRTLDSRHPTSSIGLPPLLDGMHISTNDVPSASTYPSVRSGMTPLGARPPPQHGLPTANAGGVGTMAYGALSGTPQRGGPWHMG